MWGSRFTPTVATAQKSRTLAASQKRVWEVIEDPGQLARWWPGVTRTEGVQRDRWTEVHADKRGRTVRLDFHLLESSPPSYRLWEQQLAGTRFERVLDESVTEVALERVAEGT
ncbi:MAG: SRPBCC family protein, partial [Solirubrobacterales bacterium]|nr:SRPBCC family protein [Solirubrobacterales bacterium]